MNIFKKLLIPNGETKELTAYESWVVRWYSVNKREISSWNYPDVREESEVFTTEADAREFAESLQNALDLMKSSSFGKGIRIERNKNVLRSEKV